MCVLSVSLAACGVDVEQAHQALADVYNEMADEVDAITDLDSLEAARPRILGFARRLRAMKSDWEALGEPVDTPSTWGAGSGGALSAAKQRMTAASMRAAVMPGVAKRFGKLMREFETTFAGD